ncbi:hypothetical protein BRARA_G00525 [Brassica rapa]|uniref:DUF7794 domain-containing protein n=2 Tax=Brassica TaxID=3705 RepID=A0A397YI11_BRACM|nr:uncharacterized protein LOC103828678 [Brassica rapa]XP_013747724.3 uncharacterized protein LOC106450587 [Brassica napus]KAH0917718.1 hypothetical protein HID58_025378 [Brassica napus]RID53105.1 hypothetical protein BRARA_G00525 [Brassica rapa]CAF2158746.1 unnamed protein product [Brassica napus]CAG7901326.1 unnamed protein product [Brassica rapa]VDC96622.1 unnamed protein product [Brassica rapa]
MQALSIFVVSLLLTLSYRGEATGSVFFIDGSNNQYLRPPSDQALPMSLSQVSAAVSALLGFSPPATLTPDGSSKLNKILRPNPFERPRAAFVLEIAGADDALVKETLPSHSFLGNAIRGSISSDSYKADIELPESGVAVMSVNEPSSDVTDKDMNEFASWLGGSYVAGSAEPLTGLLSIGGANVEFHLEKEAERKFASNLLALYKNIRGVVNLREDLSHGIERPAELTVGRFGGIDALAHEYGQGMVKQGMDVLLATLSKLFNLLETSHKGQIVGVIVLDERVNQESANLLSVDSSSGSSARSMAEVEGVPSGAIIAQVILVRLTLAWLTGIILLIATILGVYFLMYMPLTKDTLLYSNVKLD